jgi:hypothetical protein
MFDRAPVEPVARLGDMLVDVAAGAGSGVGQADAKPWDAARLLADAGLVGSLCSSSWKESFDWQSCTRLGKGAAGRAAALEAAARITSPVQAPYEGTLPEYGWELSRTLAVITSTLSGPEPATRYMEAISAYRFARECTMTTVPEPGFDISNDLDMNWLVTVLTEERWKLDSAGLRSGGAMLFTDAEIDNVLMPLRHLAVRSAS